MTLERILDAAVNSMIHGHHKPHCHSEHLERSARSEVENMGFASGYAEPGYADPKRGILMSNWNKFPRELADILERAGYAIEWSDEWSGCESCNRIVRTSGNSYSWLPSYVIYNDCEIICADCVRDDLDAYEEHLLNDATVADTFDIDWAERGFIKLNDHHYESGWYPGQNDTPAEVVKHVPAGYDYLFTIPTKGQFDISFDCWIRPVDGAMDND